MLATGALRWSVTVLSAIQSFLPYGGELSSYRPPSIDYFSWRLLSYQGRFGKGLCPFPTETAIARLLSDILTVLNAGDIAALALLDLSATFDTVDHSILVQRPQTSFALSSSLRLGSRQTLGHVLAKFKFGVT